MSTFFPSQRITQWAGFFVNAANLPGVGSPEFNLMQGDTAYVGSAVAPFPRVMYICVNPAFPAVWRRVEAACGDRATALGATANPTKAVAGFTIIPEMIVNITPTEGDILLDFSMTLAIPGAASTTQSAQVQLFQDGVAIPGTLRTVGITNVTATLTSSIAGSVVAIHARAPSGPPGVPIQFDARWQKSSGATTATNPGTERSLDALEVF